MGQLINEGVLVFRKESGRFSSDADFFSIRTLTKTRRLVISIAIYT